MLYFEFFDKFPGNVWYGKVAPKRSGDPDSPNFCNYTLYAYFISQVILLDILLFIIFIWMCFRCCCSRSSETDPETQNILPTGREHAPSQTWQIFWVYEKVQVNFLRSENWAKERMLQSYSIVKLILTTKVYLTRSCPRRVNGIPLRKPLSH